MQSHLCLIEQALKNAADTLQHLPHKTFVGYASYWPDVVRSTAEILLSRPYHQARMRSIHPKEVTVMDEALNWLFILTPEQRKIVWARACNISWRRLEDQDGRSHVTLRKLHTKALTTIAQNLIDDESLEIGPMERSTANDQRITTFQARPSTGFSTASARMNMT